MIFICDYAGKVIRQKGMIPNPEEGEFQHPHPFDQHKEYWDERDSLISYPCNNILESEDGKELTESDFEVEEQFWAGTYWVPTHYLVSCKVKPGTKVRQLAILLRPDIAAANEQQGESKKLTEAQAEWEFVTIIMANYIICKDHDGDEWRGYSPRQAVLETYEDMLAIIRGLPLKRSRAHLAAKEDDVGYWKEAFEKAVSFINESGIKTKTMSNNIPQEVQDKMDNEAVSWADSMKGKPMSVASIWEKASSFGYSLAIETIASLKSDNLRLANENADLKADRDNFVEWLGSRYIRLNKFWVHRYSHEMNADNWKTTEQVYEYFKEIKNTKP